MSLRPVLRPSCRGGLVVGALAVFAVASAACGAPRPSSVAPPSAAPPMVVPAGAHVVTPAPPAPGVTCSDPTASLPPPSVMPAPGQMPAGSWMARIQARGYLLAGVDQNTYLWGYRDPNTGQLTGFDIDMLHQVSQAIFGSPDRIHFVIVPNDDRIQAVRSGKVDIVAETMTINCARDQSVDFSTVYYQAGQRILVDRNSSITGPESLEHKRVCAVDGSTSLANLDQVPVAADITVWAVNDQTDCLVLLQQGQVDAISTDDAILVGLEAQDPNTKMVGPSFTSEPYGMAISKSHPEFTSFVNGVLAAERADGTWAAIYSHWLGPFTTGPPPAPPTATYRTTS